MLLSYYKNYLFRITTPLIISFHPVPCRRDASPQRLLTNDKTTVATREYHFCDTNFFCQRTLGTSRMNINTNCLVQRHELLEQLIQNVADAVISMDESARIILFNPSAEGLFDYQESEVLGKTFEFLMPERFRKRHSHHFAAFASGKRPAKTMGQRGQVVALRRDGSEFLADASIAQFQIGGH